nr:hypothetical protein [Tanacetum cinerariifolium]
MLDICVADKPMVFKAPKTSSKAESVSQGTKLGAQTGHKKTLTSSKQPSVSSKGQQKQATGGPTSLGVTSEARANPQLSSGMSSFNLNEPIYSTSFIIHSESASGNYASAASTAEADLGNSAPSDFVPQQQGMNEGTKNTSYDHLFADLDSPEDDPIIVVNDSDENKDDEVHATENVETEDTLVPKSLSSSSLPTELKDLPSKFNDITKEVKGLKNQVHNLEIELLGELKEILLKLKDFTKTVTSLTSQVVELKTLQWDLPAEFLVVPSQVEMVQTKLRTLDALPSLLNKKKIVKESTKSDSDDDKTHLSGSMAESSRIKKVKKFDFVAEDEKHIYLTNEQINQQKKIEEEAKAKAAKRKSEVRKEELIDLLGPEVVNKYSNDKLQYDRYCDKMLNRRAMSKISNCGVLTRKGPITLKVYIEDGTSEIIPNLKASDLHLGERREVMKACPNRIEKGWETIYK